MTPLPKLSRPENTRKTSTSLRLLLAICLAAPPLLLSFPDPAWAKNQKNGKTSSSEPARKKGVSKITYQRSSSEESPAERDRRMYRECKGMHNAGACRGYTQR